MKKSLLIYGFFFVFAVSTAQSNYFPPINGDEWETIDPNELGWCQANIDALYDLLDTEQTKSFLLLKDGRIVLEKYFGDYTKDSVWTWNSAGKSLTAGLVGIGESEGILSIRDKTSDYLGVGWTSLPPEQEDSITLWHQLTMTSGLDERLFACTNKVCLTYKADPGTRWIYHNGPYSLLRNVLENATNLDYNVVTRQYLTSKIGITGLWVKSGFNNLFFSNARSMARFGVLMQNRGFWENTPIIPNDFVESMINSSQDLNPSYGYLWWLNGKTSYIAPGGAASFLGPIAPSAPEDVYVAAGANGQFISISPTKALVMVRQGDSRFTSLAPLELHDEIWKAILGLECTTTSRESNRIAVNNYEIFPNPTHEYLVIHSKEELKEKAYYSLIDQFGRKVASGNLAGSKTIDLSKFQNGIYWLKIFNTDRIYSLKKILKI